MHVGVCRECEARWGPAGSNWEWLNPACHEGVLILTVITYYYYYTITIIYYTIILQLLLLLLPTTNINCVVVYINTYSICRSAKSSELMAAVLPVYTLSSSECTKLMYVATIERDGRFEWYVGPWLSGCPSLTGMDWMGRHNTYTCVFIHTHTHTHTHTQELKWGSVPAASMPGDLLDWMGC